MLAPTPKSFKRLGLEFVILVLCTLLLWFVMGYVRFSANAHALPSFWRWSITSLFFIAGLLWITAPWLRTLWQKRALVRAENKAIRENSQQDALKAAELKLKHHLQLTCQSLKRGGQQSWLQASLAQLRGRNPIYAQPWFLVLGQAHAGKSTLLTHNGAKPLALPGAPAVNWYQTSEAIFLEAPSCNFSSDTANLHAQNNAHINVNNNAFTLGQTLGKTLKKYRAQQPLNGIVLVINAQSLTLTHQQPLHDLAEQTQQTLSALFQQIGTRVPVKLVVSQLDAVPGFSQYFAGLTPAERALTWGFSLNTVTGSQSSIITECIEQLNLLENGLLQRMMDAMQHAKNDQACANVQRFPGEFSKIRQNLQNFLAALLSDASDLHGMENREYPSQTSSPMAHQIFSSAENAQSVTSVRLDSLYLTSAAATNNSFFTQQLFQQNLVANAWTSGHNQKAKQLQQWTRATAWLGMGVFACACIVAWGVGLQRHHALIVEAKAQLKTFHVAHQSAQKHLTENTVSNTDPQKLTDLVQNALDPINTLLAAYEQQTAQSQNGLRLQPGTPTALISDLYSQSLQHLFLPAMMHRLTQHLEQEMLRFEGALSAVSTDALKQGEQDNLLATFRVYRMMGDLSQRDTAQIAAWWQAYWAQQTPNQHGQTHAARTETVSSQQQWMQQLNDLLNRHQETPASADVPLNASLVRKSQNLLQQIPPATRLYAELQQAPQYRAIVPFDQQLHPSTKNIFRPVTVKPIAALYTKAGYDSLDLSEDTSSISQLSADAWLYDQSQSKQLKNSLQNAALSPAQIRAEVESAYLQDYQQIWTAHLNQYKLQKFGSIDSLVQALGLLSTEQFSPIAQLIKQVNTQTQLATSSPLGLNTQNALAQKNAGSPQTAALLNNATQAALQSTPTLVDSHFASLHQLTGPKAMVDAQGLTPLQALMLDLKNLQTYLNKIKLAQDGGKTAFTMAQARMQSGGSADAIAQLQLRADTLPAPVREWISDLAIQSWELMLRDTMAYINKQWQNSVYTPYRQQLAGRYPFNKQATREASLAEFDGFFSPEGTQATFVSQYLAPFVDTNTWQIRSLGGRGLPMSRRSLTQLKAAEGLRQAFFSQGRASAAFEFELKPLKLDSNTRRFVLDLGLTEVSYSHGPRITQKLQWPIENTRIEFNFFNRAGNTTGESYEGNWALFRAFDAAGIGEKQNRNNQLAFQTQAHLAQYQLTTNTRVNPFRVGFTCPQQL